MQVVWSPKGGVGSTSIAAALALSMSIDESVCLVDPVGGVAAALGVEPPSLGLGAWMAAPDAPADALSRLTVGVTPGLGLLGPGVSPIVDPFDADQLRAALAGVGARVVLDAGTAPATRSLVDAADESIVVLRNDALALDALDRCRQVADLAVVIVEPGRALRRRDVERRLDCPVIAVPFELAMARAVDVGLIEVGVPRSIARAVEVLR